MGFGELVVLVIVAIVVIGPKDLPKVLKKVGQWSGKLRRMAGDMRAQSGIDDVLREGDLGRDIAEIRKLARGEIDNVSRNMRIDGISESAAASLPTGSSSFTPSYDPYPNPQLGSRYVSEDREHPGVGPDGFDAMPDSSYVYGASFPRSALDRDPLYRTGSVDGVVPEDPPEERDETETETEPDGEPKSDEASASSEGANGTESAPSPGPDAASDSADASAEAASAPSDPPNVPPHVPPAVEASATSAIAAKEEPSSAEKATP